VLVCAGRTVGSPKGAYQFQVRRRRAFGWASRYSRCGCQPAGGLSGTRCSSWTQPRRTSAGAHEGLRLSLDLEWRPEDDPAGEYRLTVEYAPWLRTARGLRRKDVPLDFSGARVVHEFRTRDRAELVRELEAALVTRSEWVEHS
jgi:hypothetical protein